MEGYLQQIKEWEDQGRPIFSSLPDDINQIEVEDKKLLNSPPK